MNIPLPKPYRKVPIALFLDDIEVLRRRFGTGWTARVRELVANDVTAYKERQDARANAANLTNIRPYDPDADSSD